jgi:anti-sigma factor RsiW
MSECQQANRLSAYHDGELSPEAAAEWEAHLRQCGRCAAELERLRRLSRAMGALVPPSMPSASVARLHRVIDRLPSVGLRRMAGALAAVAATILLICTVGLSLRTSSAAPARSAAIEDWETAAVAQPSDVLTSVDSRDLLARWMVRDLGQEAEE